MRRYGHELPPDKHKGHFDEINAVANMVAKAQLRWNEHIAIRNNRRREPPRQGPPRQGPPRQGPPRQGPPRRGPPR